MEVLTPFFFHNFSSSSVRRRVDSQAGDVIQNVACERGRYGEVIGYVWEYEIDRQLTQTMEAEL